MKFQIVMITGLLVGCQNPVKMQALPQSDPLTQAHVWMSQGHWVQALDVLEPLTFSHASDPAVWRALGEVHWRLGVEAMASYAALRPNAKGLEGLGNHVFKIEEWLDENATRYNAGGSFGPNAVDGLIDRGDRSGAVVMGRP